MAGVFNINIMAIEGNTFVMGIGKKSCSFIKDEIEYWAEARSSGEDVSSIFSRPHLSDLYDKST